MPKFLALLISAATLSAQDIPLKNWPAALYWQPSTQEAEASGLRAEVRGDEPKATTPGESLVFVAMTPCRLVDTRSGSGFTGAFGPPSLIGGASRTFPIQSSAACSIPSIAQAYSFNVTVVPPGTLGFLTAYPTGQPRPLASTLNSVQGFVVANAAIVPAGASGSVDVYASNNTDLIIDINGYYAPSTGITLAQGTAAAPSLSFLGDAGTGIFSSGAGILNFTTGGAAALAVGGASENTAIGLSAFSNNTTGLGNTASGAFALQSNTTGSFNTASGSGTLVFNSIGSSNTASGFSALVNNITGNTNTATGSNALYLNFSGSNNTALGNLAGFNILTGSNNIDIGNIAVSTDGTSANTGVIRIGDSTLQKSFFAAGINGVMTGGAGTAVLIDSNGQLGTISSSRRYKEDIEDLGDDSSGLLRLRPVKFRYRQPYADGSKPIDYGLIAEEVAEVYPDLVVKNKDAEIETVQYHKLIPMLLNELRKDHETMQMLKEQVAALERSR